jgi:hypothetical protein
MKIAIATLVFCSSCLVAVGEGDSGVVTLDSGLHPIVWTELDATKLPSYADFSMTP